MKQQPHNSQLDSFISNTLKNTEIEFQPETWQEMETMLDFISKKKSILSVNKKHIFIFVGIILFAVSVFFLINKFVLNNNSSEKLLVVNDSSLFVNIMPADSQPNTTIIPPDIIKKKTFLTDTAKAKIVNVVSTTINTFGPKNIIPTKSNVPWKNDSIQLIGKPVPIYSDTLRYQNMSEFTPLKNTIFHQNDTQKTNAKDDRGNKENRISVTTKTDSILSVITKEKNIPPPDTNKKIQEIKSKVIPIITDTVKLDTTKKQDRKKKEKKKKNKKIKNE
ncbi:MAG: hypothetical protein V1781_04045 [Bacteroidota bacterium]